MKEIAQDVLGKWKRIDVQYRSTCKKIILFGLKHEEFKEKELAKEIVSVWSGWKNDVAASVRSLVNANILSSIGDQKYRLHSKVEKDYLATCLHELR